MGKLILKKVQAATLVETIVALVVILTVFAIATTIVVQVTAAGASVNNIKARATLNEYAQKTREQKTFFDAEATSEEYYISKEVTVYEENDLLRSIHYYIYDKFHHLLDDWREVVLIE